MVKENGQLVEQYAYGSYGERMRDGLGNQYVYDGELRLAAIHGRNVQNTVGFHYDKKGQLIEKQTAEGTIHYAYNQYGSLTDVVLPDGRHISYIIDPAGRRIAKAVNGIVVEKYCWYDMVRLMGVCDGNDQNGVQFLYTESPSGSPNWLPTAMRMGNDVYGLAFDQAGALLAIADGNGNVIQQSKHDSFGSEIGMLNPHFILPVSFGGGLLDRDTGLIHFVYRDYDPATAHFIQPDPLGYAAGDIEIYGWCLDDPVNLIDPLGLAGEEGDAGKRTTDGQLPSEGKINRPPSNSDCVDDPIHGPICREKPSDHQVLSPEAARNIRRAIIIGGCAGLGGLTNSAFPGTGNVVGGVCSGFAGEISEAMEPKQ